MQKILIFSLIAQLIFYSCRSQDNTSARLTDSVLKIEMNLSAFGVESDNFPSIRAYIDFRHHSSNCIKSYYSPAFKDAIYHLSSGEIKKVFDLLQNSDLKKLKSQYKVNKTDQPTSTTTIFTTRRNYIIKDYGLVAEGPLQKVYKIVYKF